LTLLEQLRDLDFLRSLVYYSLGSLALLENASKEAREQLEAGYELSKSQTDDRPVRRQLQTVFLIALAFCRISAPHDDTMSPPETYLTRARELAQGRKDAHSIATIDTLAYVLDGNVDNALRDRRFKQAKAYFLRGGELSKVMTAQAFPVLGPTRLSEDAISYPSGLRVAQDSHAQLITALKSTIGNSNESSIGALAMLGNMELQANHLDQAEAYLQMALQLCKPPTQRNAPNRVIIYRLLGCIALDRSQWDEAKRLWQEGRAALAETPASTNDETEEQFKTLISFAERRYHPMAQTQQGSTTST
jgi:tetratricopeptide (TPR) repeat protein